MSRKIEDEAWARQQIADVPALCAIMAFIGLASLATVFIDPGFLPIGFVVVALLIGGGLHEMAKTIRAKRILNKADDA